LHHENEETQKNTKVEVQLAVEHKGTPFQIVTTIVFFLLPASCRNPIGAGINLHSLAEKLQPVLALQSARDPRSGSFVDKLFSIRSNYVALRLRRYLLQVKVWGGLFSSKGTVSQVCDSYGKID
jgi:hypothetical protein